jgi:hypothetical protein
MNIKACSRTRTHVALLGLLLPLQLASQCDAYPARHEQQVALQPSLATWAEAYERCATLGRRLAPPELAAQQAAAEDGLFGPATTQQCKPRGSEATVLWVDVDHGSRREAPPGPGVPGRAMVDQCQGLVFNHTSRQAHAAPAACGKRHCFLCSAPQAGLRMSTTEGATFGRRLMVADSSNCNMTGQQLCRPALALLQDYTAESFPRHVCRARAPVERRKCFRMGRLGEQERLPVRVARGLDGRVARGAVQRHLGCAWSGLPVVSWT